MTVDESSLSHLKWRRSSTAPEGVGIEVASDDTTVYMRSERHPDLLRFTFEEWRAFIEGTRGGEFDI